MDRKPFYVDDLVRFSLRARKAIKTSKAIVVNPESQKFVYLQEYIFRRPLFLIKRKYNVITVY